MTAAAPAHNVLLVVNETVAGNAPLDMIADPDDTAVLVIAPALNTRVRHWMSDEDPARRQASERLAASVASLRAAGLRVDGRVGDADPLQAIADALAVFAADELLIATPPEHRCNWLARDIVRRADARFALPVARMVLDDVQSLHRVLTPMRPRRSSVLTAGPTRADCGVDRPNVRQRHQLEEASA